VIALNGHRMMPLSPFEYPLFGDLPKQRKGRDMPQVSNPASGILGEQCFCHRD
jgi:hypothetical protein